jgi:hypothetical protein
MLSEHTSCHSRAAFGACAGSGIFLRRAMRTAASVSVVSADGICPDSGNTLLHNGGAVSPEDLAARLASREAGYVIQRHMAPDLLLAAEFGSRLWSVRLLVLLTSDGPLIQRAIAKIATGPNPADNF